jgi:hypothetical protein
VAKKIHITGLQEAQRANLSLIRTLQPGGALEAAVKAGTTLAQQAAVRKTPVDTGSLRASHRINIQGLRGMVYIDPSAKNPRSGGKPADYGPIVHARGGQRAFYARVVAEEGNAIGKAARSEYLRGLRRR